MENSIITYFKTALHSNTILQESIVVFISKILSNEKIKYNYEMTSVEEINLW